MFDILVYLFENFYQADGYPDPGTLSRKLHAAGFENEEIHDAIAWLNGLEPPRENNLLQSLESSRSFRGFTALETTKLTTEGRGFLAFLESAHVLSPLLREIIIERAMALPDATVGLEKLKVIVLIVLWTRRGSVDALILDELLPEGEKRQMH